MDTCRLGKCKIHAARDSELQYNTIIPAALLRHSMLWRSCGYTSAVVHTIPLHGFGPPLDSNPIPGDLGDSASGFYCWTGCFRIRKIHVDTLMRF